MGVLPNEGGLDLNGWGDDDIMDLDMPMNENDFNSVETKEVKS